MAARFLDTNVLIAFYLGAPPERAPRARDLMSRMNAGQEQLVTTSVVFFEVAYLLQRSFRIPRPLVAEFIESVALSPGLVVEDQSLLLDAVEVYRTIGGLSLPDAYNAAYMRRRGVTEVYSWDTDFDRIDGLTRVEPA